MPAAWTIDPGSATIGAALGAALVGLLHLYYQHVRHKKASESEDRVAEVAEEGNVYSRENVHAVREVRDALTGVAGLHQVREGELLRVNWHRSRDKRSLDLGDFANTGNPSIIFEKDKPSDRAIVEVSSEAEPDPWRLTVHETAYRDARASPPEEYTRDTFVLHRQQVAKINLLFDLDTSKPFDRMTVFLPCSPRAEGACCEHGRLRVHVLVKAIDRLGHKDKPAAPARDVAEARPELPLVATSLAASTMLQLSTEPTTTRGLIQVFQAEGLSPPPDYVQTLVDSLMNAGHVSEDDQHRLSLTNDGRAKLDGYRDFLKRPQL
jgi:hypothetical protein